MVLEQGMAGEATSNRANRDIGRSRKTAKPLERLGDLFGAFLAGVGSR